VRIACFNFGFRSEYSYYLPWLGRDYHRVVKATARAVGHR
jgi:hypothetical protein